MERRMLIYGKEKKSVVGTSVPAKLSLTVRHTINSRLTKFFYRISGKRWNREGGKPKKIPDLFQFSQ